MKNTGMDIKNTVNTESCPVTDFCVSNSGSSVPISYLSHLGTYIILNKHNQISALKINSSTNLINRILVKLNE